MTSSMNSHCELDMNYRGLAVLNSRRVKYFHDYSAMSVQGVVYRWKRQAICIKNRKGWFVDYR